MASALEQSLIDLSNEHGLASISITLMTSPELEADWLDVSVQWVDGTRHCASANGTAITFALSKAIAEMKVKRLDYPLVMLPDEPLIAEAA